MRRIPAFSATGNWFLRGPHASKPVLLGLKFHLLLVDLLARAHRAFAAFLASSFLSSGLSNAMRAFTPFPLAALPPFLPISRITSKTRSRRMTSFYDGIGFATKVGS